MENKTLNVNLFGGPCVGKSATCSGVHNALKLDGYNADLTTEYAKDLVYGEEWVRLSDQLSVAGEQHHRMFRLQGKVDVAVHDSPFIMGINYCCDTRMPVLQFSEFLVGQFNRYRNLNIMLVRNKDLDYKEEGRLQNIDESIELDNQIQMMLDKNGIKYFKVPVGDDTTDMICDLVEMELTHV